MYGVPMPLPPFRLFFFLLIPAFFVPPDHLRIAPLSDIQRCI